VAEQECTVLTDVVIDSNALFDLNVGGVLGNILFLKDIYIFSTTVFIEGELRTIDTGNLRKIGIRFEDLSGSEVKRLENLVIEYPAASYEDLSALVLAARLGCMLLTRDGALQEAADKAGVPWDHSVWVIEQMVTVETLQPVEAMSVIQSIVSKCPRFKDGIGMDRFKKLMNVR
jgi:rRNA-processing protein FCF1